MTLIEIEKLLKELDPYETYCVDIPLEEGQTVWEAITQTMIPMGAIHESDPTGN